MREPPARDRSSFSLSICSSGRKYAAAHVSSQNALLKFHGSLMCGEKTHSGTTTEQSLWYLVSSKATWSFCSSEGKHGIVRKMKMFCGRMQLFR